MECPPFVHENNEEFALQNFNLPKKYRKEWKSKLGWLYDFPWERRAIVHFEGFSKKEVGTNLSFKQCLVVEKQP